VASRDGREGLDVTTRFDLEWIVPVEPGLATHVRLFDPDVGSEFPLAVGHGADEVDALMHLWIALVAGREHDAANFVASAYAKGVGHLPGQESGNQS
jgi:hypothetical protein